MAQAETYPDFYSDPGVIERPREYFARMRALGPVVREEYHGSLIVTGYDAVNEAVSYTHLTLPTILRV